MTLNEAILHCEKVAEEQEQFYYQEGYSYFAKKHCECASEYRKLVEWLKELKTLRHYIVTELEISCASSNDIFDENDERYYVLDKLNSMIAIADRYPNNLREKTNE